VFPAVSPTVANDTDSAVRAVMVEVKQPMRGTAVAGKGKWKYAAKGKWRKVAIKTRSNVKVAARSRKPQATARIESKPAANAPLNLRKANTKPAKKISGKSRGASG
jgi:hypothetical protein